MRSQLYECQVRHARFTPKPHSFAYRIFMFALDLDEIEHLPGKLALFSSNRRNLYSFHDGDYLPTGETVHNPDPRMLSIATDSTAPKLKQRVLNFLQGQGIDLPEGRVVLVTLPRICGYLFNPVSFYFCYDAEGQPVAAMAEVTNTFREMKPFLLGAPKMVDDRFVFQARLPKQFYVSPYSDVDVAFDFELHNPAEFLDVRIDDYTEGRRTFTSSLTGPRRDLTNGRLLWFTCKYPLLTLRIITLIHWHALILWLKHVPWYPKAARSTDQRGLYRPHASLTQPTDAT